MKRPLILALALLLVTASAVDARPRKPHPHAAVVPGNDIAVSDTTFPGDALITYTYVEDDGAPWARVDCIALDGPSPSPSARRPAGLEATPPATSRCSRSTGSGIRCCSPRQTSAWRVDRDWNE